MTAPVVGGYPDWVRQQSTAQVLEINDLGVTKNGVFTYPVRYVGNAQWLTVWAQTLTRATQFQVEFWADAAGTVIIDRYTMDVPIGGVARQPVPILGPFMDVSVAPFGAGNYTYSLQVARSGVKGSFAGSIIEQSVFAQNIVTIGAGATDSHTSFVVKEGWATWTASVSGTPWVAVITASDYTGLVTVLDYMDNTVAAFNRRQIYLPPSIISMQITNFNAAAQTYRLFMSREYNAA